MPEKILYILGAGASVNALPLARSVWNNIDQSQPVIPGLLYELENINMNNLLQLLNQKDYGVMIEKLKDDFKLLAFNAKDFGDVDTYAKYLQIMRPDELRDLKKTLSSYFVVKQVMHGVRDKRYLPWLVSLMETRRFPDNVKILSRNYDFQVELAAGQMGDLEEVKHEGSGFMHSPSWLTHYPNADSTFSDFHLLSLIHLNGIAGYIETSLSNSGSVFQKQYNTVDAQLQFLEKDDLSGQMHFAWEKSGYHNKLMKYVMNMIDHITILVVIGYSFPFFNRTVDKKIFEKIATTSFELKKFTTRILY